MSYFGTATLPYIILILFCVRHYDTAGEEEAEEAEEAEENLSCLAINKASKYHPLKKVDERFPKNPCKGPVCYWAPNFTELAIYSHIFIDKTLVLKPLLLNPNDSILLLTPKRWGKTLTLDMLKTFVEIEVDQNGDKIENPDLRNNLNLFTNGQIYPLVNLKYPLLINKHKDLYEKFQGKYPVVHIDLFFFGINSFPNFKTVLNLKICKCFRKHWYMLNVFQRIMNSTTSTPEEKKRAEVDYYKFEKIVARHQTNNDDLMYSLQYLSELLYRYYNQKVYMLIDDCDDLIHYCLFECPCHHRDIIFDFYYEFLTQSLQNNSYIYRTVATAMTPISRRYVAGYNNGLSHLVEYKFTDKPFRNFFGYTERELQILYDYTKMPREDRKLISDWCDLYDVNITAPVKLYNARFINVYLDKKDFFYYDLVEPERRFYEPITSKIKKLPGYEPEWYVYFTEKVYSVGPNTSFNWRV